jgi:photosystem II stability/assembly factor-like uncharacterized protein
MKSLFTLTALVLLSAAAVHAQWTEFDALYGGPVLSLTRSGSNIIAGTSYGVYTSNDAGLSWSKGSGLLGAQSVAGLPGTDTVWAGTVTGPYLSTDAGVTWAPRAGGIGWASIASIAVDAGRVIAMNYQGVYRSTDAGVTWTSTPSGLPSTDARSVCVSGTNVWAGRRHSGWFYRSTDFGATWLKSDSGMLNVNVTRIQKIGDRLYASFWGGDGIAVSDDDGATWKTFSSKLLGKIVFGVAFKNGVLTAVTSDGFWISPDSGKTGSYTYIADAQGYSDAEYLATETALYSGQYDGVYISTDNGATWDRSMEGIHETTTVGVVKHVNSYIAATDQDGVFRSNNSGGSWSRVLPGFTYGVNRTLLSYGNVLLLGAVSGLVRSTDGGTTWTSSSTGITGSPNVFTFVTNGASVYAGTGSGKVYRSDDSGSTWTPLAPIGLGNSIQCMIVTDPAGPTIVIGRTDSIFVTTDGGGSWTPSVLPSTGSCYSFLKAGTGLLAGRSDGLFQSTDNGLSWVKDSIPWSNGAVTSLIKSGQNIFATSGYSGVYRSNGFGTPWTNIPAPGVLLYGPLTVINTQIYCSSRNQGLWKINLADVKTEVAAGPGTLPAGTRLEQNYPNPFNPSTTIQVGIKNSEFVTLKVYDMLGREVRTLFEGNLDAGEHRINFDAAGLASGTYMIRLVTPQGTSTRKTILLR